MQSSVALKIPEIIIIIVCSVVQSVLCTHNTRITMSNTEMLAMMPNG